MTIQYCSDLHLDFRENRDFITAHPLVCKGDVLILAGDIIPFATMDKHQDFFSYISDQFPVTYWLPGNHEYYYSDVAIRSGSFQEEIRSNVFLVNNLGVSYKNQDFIFSSLWSSLSIANAWKIEQAMSDFQVIRYGSEVFSSETFNNLHQESVSFLTTQLCKNESRKAIVVTHHVPTFTNFPTKYQDDPFREAYAVELSMLIEKYPVPLWIYGHHHCNVADFYLGCTRLVTNQLGYVRYNDYKSFQHSKTVVI